MYIRQDNYIPVNEDKCESCIHHHACLACCHNKNTSTTTLDTVDYNNYEGHTDTTTRS